MVVHFNRENKLNSGRTYYHQDKIESTLKASEIQIKTNWKNNLVCK